MDVVDGALVISLRRQAVTFCFEHEFIPPEREPTRLKYTEHVKAFPTTHGRRRAGAVRLRLLPLDEHLARQLPDGRHVFAARAGEQKT